MSDTPTPESRTTGVIGSSYVRNEELDLWQLVRTIWRGKWWITLTTVIAALIGGYYAYYMTIPVYTSSALVALQSRKEQVTDLTGVVSGLSGNQATINTEIEVLRSRELVGKLVDKLKLAEDPRFNGQQVVDVTRPSIGLLKAKIKEYIWGAPPPAPAPTKEALRGAAIGTILGAIQISNVRQSYVFRITAVTTSAQQSALIANTLADFYILDQLEVKFQATEQATSWLTDRVGQLQSELETAEGSVKEFVTSSALISPEALGGMNRQIKDLRDRVGTLEADEIDAQKRLTALQAVFDSNDPTVIAKAAQDRTLTRVLKLLADGGESARATFDARFGQILTRSKLDLQRIVGQREALQASIIKLETQIESQSTDLVALQQLQREAEASRLIYEYFLGRLKETSVQQGIQQADSRILSRAVVPYSPSAPNKSRMVMMAIVFGFLVGAGLVLLRELLQNTFRTAEDLSGHTGYTVMGQIPKIPARKRLNVLKYLQDKPNSAAAESIRNLRTSVVLSNLDNPPQIIMSTSAIPGEGKTTHSIALAQNFADLGKRVLLIEGDIRRLVFTNYFDFSEERGLLSVLSGQASLEDVVIHDPGLGLDILKGEKSSTNAADVFSSAKFTSLLEQARSSYDIIIVDTPPVLVVPDARVIGQSVDAILMSVRWNATSKSQVEEALRLFETVNLRVTGLVLSQIDMKGMKRYGYGKDYGAYGSYGSHYYTN